MKQIAFLMIVLFATAAAAQAPAKDAAKPEPMKEAAKPEAAKTAAKPEPVKVAAKPEPMKAAAPKKPRRWNEDARHCLDQGSNTEVIKCAEEFF